MRYADLLQDTALRAYVASFNARARALGHTDLLLETVRDRILSSGGRCEWCGTSLVGHDFELDHVISLREGGAHSPDNLVVACPSCNRHKGHKPPIRFALEVVAQYGRQTPFVQRLLQAHQIEGRVQKPMFDNDDAPPDDPDTGGVYNWHR